MPPSLHWALVLVLALVTCGLFPLIWLFIEASFIKKIRPASNVTMLLVIAIVLALVGYAGVMVSAMEQSTAGMSLCSLIYLAAIALNIVAIFKARSLLLEYYNTVEPINLRLSGVMTFFFAVLYFQYHFTRIAEWKRTGRLAPQ